jgi:hypothetical protein
MARAGQSVSSNGRMSVADTILQQESSLSPTVHKSYQFRYSMPVTCSGHGPKLQHCEKDYRQCSSVNVCKFRDTLISLIILTYSSLLSPSRKLIVAHVVNKFPPYSSQRSASRRYLQPDESTPRPCTELF